MDSADASLPRLPDALDLTDIATLDSGFRVYRTERGHGQRDRFIWSFGLWG